MTQAKPVYFIHIYEANIDSSDEQVITYHKLTGEPPVCFPLSSPEEAPRVLTSHNKLYPIPPNMRRVASVETIFPIHAEGT